MSARLWLRDSGSWQLDRRPPRGRGLGSGSGLPYLQGVTSWLKRRLDCVGELDGADGLAIDRDLEYPAPERGWHVKVAGQCGPDGGHRTRSRRCAVRASGRGLQPLQPCCRLVQAGLVVVPVLVHWRSRISSRVDGLLSERPGRVPGRVLGRCRFPACCGRVRIVVSR